MLQVDMDKLWVCVFGDLPDWECYTVASGLSLVLFLSHPWTEAVFIRASARLLYQRRTVSHHLWISNWILLELFQRILTHAILEVPTEKLVWLVCNHQRGLSVFSNNFPCSLYGNNMSLPVSPEPFLSGIQSRVHLLPLGSSVTGSSTEHITWHSFIGA